MSEKKIIAGLYVNSFLYALAVFVIFKQIPFYAVYAKEMNLAAISIYTWIPGVFALYFAKKEKIQLHIFSKCRKPFLFAVFVPFVIAALGVLLTCPFAQFSLSYVIEAASNYSLSFPSKFFNISLFILALYFLSIVSCVSLNFFLYLGQELFWRGYLLEKLSYMSFKKRNIVSGCLFGLWLAPMVVFFDYNYFAQKFWGFALMMGFSLVVTPILSYLRSKENSVMSSTIFYSMIVTFCPIDVAFFPEGNPLFVAPVGLGGLLALACIAAPIFYSRKERDYKAARV